MSLRSKVGIKRVPQGPGGEGRQECVLDWGKLVLRIEKSRDAGFSLLRGLGVREGLYLSLTYPGIRVRKRTLSWMNVLRYTVQGGLGPQGISRCSWLSPALLGWCSTLGVSGLKLSMNISCREKQDWVWGKSLLKVFAWIKQKTVWHCLPALNSVCFLECLKKCQIQKTALWLERQLSIYSCSWAGKVHFHIAECMHWKHFPPAQLFP